MHKPSKVRRFLPLIAGGLVVALALAGMLWLISGMLGKKEAATKRQTLQVVKIIRPPPEAPPPPPPPPPPEKVAEPLPKDLPDEKPDATPPDQPLGIDADAAAGSDGFGLAARKGGRDLIGSEAGAFAGYTALLKGSVLDVLSDDDRIRHGSYSVTLRVWLAPDGKVDRITITQPSGNKQVDDFIQQDLGHLSRIREAPPLEMPQPVTFKIVLRS